MGQTKGHRGWLKRVDKKMSKMVRLRDTVGYEYINDKKVGYGNCFTCGKKTYTETKLTGDAGHFQVRAKLLTRYDERNVHLQCKECNKYGKGQQYRHGKAIDGKYGIGTAEELEIKANGIAKLTIFELQGLDKELDIKIKAYIKDNG